MDKQPTFVLPETNDVKGLVLHSALLLKQNLWLLIIPTFVALFKFLRTAGHRGPLCPPGPPTLPIIGNANIFPRRDPHLTFTEWARHYGDVISCVVMGQTIIVLNTPTLVKEIFDKRSVSNSNRPFSTIAELITPGGLNMGTCHEADHNWKVMRKPIQSLLAKESLKRYTPLQEAEATQLMMDLVHDPTNWYTNIQRFTTSFTMMVTWGARGPRYVSPEVYDFQHVHHRFMTALEFGTAPPVDLFPFLKLVPARFAKWKRESLEIRHLHETLYSRLLERVKARLDNGLGNGCFMEDAVTNANEWGMKNDHFLFNLGGTILEGSDTTSASTQYIFLCALAFPEKAQKVREEIDRVVGPGRMPVVEDIEDLPYTHAFVEECSRFVPVANLGLPHEMNKDDIYDGMLFPKGAIVFQNSYFMFNDERYYDRPFEFLPERYFKHPLGINPDVEDDPARRDSLLFGGGRRICPGLHLAKSNLDLLCARTMWGFDLKPAIDPSTGKRMKIDINEFRQRASGGITCVLQPFPIDIKPRSNEYVDVIQAEFTRCAEVLRPYEHELNEEDRRYNATFRDRELI